MQNEILGLTIEPMHGETDHIGNIAYYLHGKRTTYRLVRYNSKNGEPNPEMFVVNSKGNLCAIKGNKWFTDENGFLEVIN